MINILSLILLSAICDCKDIAYGYIYKSSNNDTVELFLDESNKNFHKNECVNGYFNIEIPKRFEKIFDESHGLELKGVFVSRNDYIAQIANEKFSFIDRIPENPCDNDTLFLIYSIEENKRN